MSRFAAINLGTPVSSEPVNRGLTLHWLPLVQRPQGSKALDLRGRYDGTPSLGAVLTSGRGRPGYAWQFDTDAKIETASTLTDSSSTFTIAGWFRYDAAPSGTNILSGLGGRWRVQRSGGNLTITREGSEDNQFSSLPISNGGQWYFFAITVTGTSAVGYLDGATQSITLPGTISTGGNPFYIGDRPFGSFGLAGQMTDFRLYGRVLSPAEVTLVRRDGMFGQHRTLSRSRRRSRGTVAAPAATRAGWLCLLGAGR